MYRKFLLLILVLLTLTLNAFAQTPINASVDIEDVLTCADECHDHDHDNYYSSVCSEYGHLPNNPLCGPITCFRCKTYLGEIAHIGYSAPEKINGSSTECYFFNYKCMYCNQIIGLPSPIYPHNMSSPQWVRANPITPTLCEELKSSCTFFGGCSYSIVTSTVGHTYSPYSCNCFRCNFDRGHNWISGPKLNHKTASMCYSDTNECTKCGKGVTIKTYYTHYNNPNGLCYLCGYQS